MALQGLDAALSLSVLTMRVNSIHGQKIKDLI
jgi:hypothetical protein